jgi:hypothetical protein
MLIKDQLQNIPTSLASDKSPNQIIRHIARVKKPSAKEYYLSSQLDMFKSDVDELRLRLHHLDVYVAVLRNKK